MPREYENKGGGFGFFFWFWFFFIQSLRNVLMLHSLPLVLFLIGQSTLTPFFEGTSMRCFLNRFIRLALS